MLQIWHERIHTRERPYSCSACPKRFRSLPYQQSHAAHAHRGSEHQDLPAYTCRLCDKTFPSSQKLSSHVLTHNVSEPHQDIAQLTWKGRTGIEKVHFSKPLWLKYLLNYPWPVVNSLAVGSWKRCYVLCILGPFHIRQPYAPFRIRLFQSGVFTLNRLLVKHRLGQLDAQAGTPATTGEALFCKGEFTLGDRVCVNLLVEIPYGNALNNLYLRLVRTIQLKFYSYIQFYWVISNISKIITP